uniref:Uncharacterized protein n=1 Tax=Leersia perrieri TaxID=77586 RepID=A0A0D9X3B5_9ORYZ
MTPGDAFLILELVAGNRLIPNSIFTTLLIKLPSVSPHTSPRLRAGLALRALDAALSETEAPAPAAVLLHKARAVLADPDLSPCFPEHLASFSADDAPSAAVADLKRLVDLEWASLPPSKLEIAAERIVGSEALHLWASADPAQRSKLRLLVGESTARDILNKLQQDASTNRLPQLDHNAPKTKATYVSDCAQQTDRAGSVELNAKADRPQQDTTRHQQESVHGVPSRQLQESSIPGASITSSLLGESIRGKEEAIPARVTGQFAPENIKNHQITGSKHSLMERNSTASTFEWDGLGDSDAERPAAKRQLPSFERITKPSPTAAHKMRNKWSEIQEKTLLEGVQAHGKGNWKEIKMAYPDVFEDRSTVDLKDKFRNLERHLCV